MAALLSLYHAAARGEDGADGGDDGGAGFVQAMVAIGQR